MKCKDSFALAVVRKIGRYHDSWCDDDVTECKEKWCKFRIARTTRSQIDASGKTTMDFLFEKHFIDNITFLWKL